MITIPGHAYRRNPEYHEEYTPSYETVMKKTFALSLALIVAGLAMWASYAMKGSYVDAEGVLQEPFYLLALGWFTNITGMLLFLTSMAVYLWKRSK